LYKKQDTKSVETRTNIVLYICKGTSQKTID